jgi:hypothetical protein
MIEENIYIQYFLGLSSFQPNSPFDSTLFPTLRKRLGKEEFDELICRIIEKAKGLEKNQKKKEVVDKKEEKPPAQVDPSDKKPGKDKHPSAHKDEPRDQEVKSSARSIKNKGTLKLDATVADQMIVYPTDLGLLNKARLESERIIDILYKQSSLRVKPRTYRRIARKSFLAISKKRKKTKKVLRKGIGSQLRFLRRNFKTIEKLLDALPQPPFPLKYRDLKIYWVIQHVYEQQKYMYENKVQSHSNRIVNIYQPYVRPIPRGKDKGKTEFGAKLGVSEFDGFCRLNHLSWEAYHEAADLPIQVEAYKDLLGYYPEVVLADQIYLTRKNREWLKSNNIRHVGRPLGRPKKMTPYQKRKLRKERNMRNHIEGKFGQAKNAYELSRIRARRDDTSESWISAIFLVEALVRWLKIAPLMIWFILYFTPWLWGFLLPQSIQTWRHKPWVKLNK